MRLLSRVIARITRHGRVAAWLAVVAVLLGSAVARGDPDDVSFDNDTLRAYVTAYLEVRALKSRYAERIRDAFLRDEEARLRREREAAVEQAIEDAGLTPETYQRVHNTVEANRELRGRVARLIVEIRQAR